MKKPSKYSFWKLWFNFADTDTLSTYLEAMSNEAKKKKTPQNFKEQVTVDKHFKDSEAIFGTQLWYRQQAVLSFSFLTLFSLTP